MKPTILEKHDDELIVYYNGKVETIPNKPYTKLKRMYFDNNRILYKFADFVLAEETYNPRVFNLTYDKLRITVRQEHADRICEAIEDHYKKGDYVKFKELFLDVYSVEHQDELVEKFILGLSKNIRIEKKHFQTPDDIFNEINEKNIPLPVYTIHNRFAVDAMGTSYFYSEDTKSWIFLCTVIQGNNQKYKIPLKNIGWINLPSVTSDIISKIMFFLHPLKSDSVFTNQLKTSAPKLHNSIMTGKYPKIE